MKIDPDFELVNKWLSYLARDYSVKNIENLRKIFANQEIYVPYKKLRGVSEFFHKEDSSCFTRKLFNPPWNYGQVQDTWASREITIEKAISNRLLPCIDCFYEELIEFLKESNH